MENQRFPLVSASATPPLFSVQGSDVTGNGQAAGSTLPNIQQQAAVNELKDFSEETIFAWLAFIRSLEHGFHYRNAAGGLSCQQVSAVFTLRDCSDSNIILWLRSVAAFGRFQ